MNLRIAGDRPAIDEQLFRNIVRSTFGKRRKTILNGLKFLGFTDEHARKVRFDFSRRPEQLSVEDFRILTDLLLPLKEDLDLPFS